MAESSWPTTAGGRAINDVQWELMARGLAADGIIGMPSETAPVYGDSTGMQVKIRANKTAIVRGHGWTSGSSDFTKAIASNSSGQARIDLIVLRLTRSTWAVTTEVRQGTPASSPQPPTLTQDAPGAGTGVWEIPIAQVAVGHGVSTITAANVTNVAWYTSGDVVSTVSTSLVQPSALQYPSMRHHDTDRTYESVSGAWRRSPWGAPWGLVGGTRYTSGVNYAAGIFNSEVVANMNSGPVTLEANRRYRLHVHLRISSSKNDNFFWTRVRENNVSGALIFQGEQLMRAIGAYHWWYFTKDFTVSSTTTKTYVVTLQAAQVGIDSAGGTSSQPVGIWFEDIGPAVPNVINTW